MEKLIQFKNKEEIVDYAAQTNKILLVYNDYVLDATTFACHHPGGAGLILNYQTKDVTEQMQSHHPLTLRMADSLVVGSFKKEISKFINPDRPLMDQIWEMDHQAYLNIVESPHWLFTPSPAMFENKLLEWFSHNKWYHIFILPFFMFNYWFATTDFSQNSYSHYFLIFFIGFFSFTLIEYVLHRFIFHSENYLPNNPMIRYLHYSLHGIHHTLPSDPDRLVYPPFLFVMTYIVLHFTYLKLVSTGDDALDVFYKIGFIIGYLMYDCTHYALHHVDTTKSKGSYFHRLQKYHNKHHFGTEKAGYGVSSSFWDIVFRTEFSKKVSQTEQHK